MSLNARPKNARPKNARPKNARPKNARRGRPRRARRSTGGRRGKEAREKTHPREEQHKGAPAVPPSGPEARRMRFPDGAVRAGYNLQTAAVPDRGLIVAVMKQNPSHARRPGQAPLESWPALLAAVTDIDGNITGIQRTWLDSRRPDKAPLADPRRALGHLLGNGV